MIQQKLQQLRDEIKTLAQQAGRQPDEVKLIAVSKTRPLAEVEQAIAAGQIDFGENTVQDALTKIPQLQHSSAQWHFIGHLQSKKSKNIPGNFQWIHTVDSEKLARKLHDAMSEADVATPLNCLLQVNVAQEGSKSGLLKSEVKPFIEALLKADYSRLRWRGLMTMGVQGDDGATQHVFAELRKLQLEMQQQFALSEFDQLSMGMSGDYAVAIKEGATMVRIGTAIFGQR